MFNSTSTTEDAYRLGKVNALYGPGTVGAWYLTVLAVFISWSLHPEKRSSDSISLDFITVLTLPAVACGHLLSLLHEQWSWILDHSSTYNGDYHENMTHYWDETRRLAAYAPFTIIRNFQPIGQLSVLALMVASCSRPSLNRVTLLQLVVLFCCIVMSILCPLFALHKDGSMPDRGLIEIPWDDMAPTWSIATLPLIIYGRHLFAIFKPQKLLGKLFSSDGDQYQDVIEFPVLAKILIVGELKIALLLNATACTIAYPFVAFGIAGGFRNTGGRLDPTLARTTGPKALRFLFPRSSSSITDPDQAVALAAGAMVLLYNCIPILSIRYESWAKKKRLYSLPPSTRSQSRSRGWLRWQQQKTQPAPPSLPMSARMAYYPEDFDIRSIRKPGPVQVRSSEAAPPTHEELSLCSGALLVNVTEEEPDAPLPSAPTRVRRPQGTLQVHFADEVEEIV